MRVPSVTPHLLPPLHRWFFYTRAMRICDEWVEKGCRRGSSGERDSWKDAGEGMEGGWRCGGKVTFWRSQCQFQRFFQSYAPVRVFSAIILLEGGGGVLAGLPGLGPGWLRGRNSPDRLGGIYRGPSPQASLYNSTTLSISITKTPSMRCTRGGGSELDVVTRRAENNLKK